MNNIRILDCTLRDGGYCNNWSFGHNNIQTIINGLVEANLNIIECGYISQKQEFNNDRTQFTSFADVGLFIPKDREDKIFVGMINYGEFEINDIPDYNGDSVEGIRVAFHKKQRVDALEFCRQIKEKGYKVFIQGMVSLSYTDEEFVDLIRRVNAIEPYAFYIVDSFGMMKGKDLIRLFYTVEHNLKETIHIGFHSHNNMQLAYSNCLSLAQVQTNRSIILDASIYGMGRGAGNLNTELFIQYLNENAGANYELKPLLTIIDEIIDNFYRKNYWGYSLPNYISAKNNAHPNYAGFLDDKKTLTVEDMENIFQLMDENKKVGFDKIYIEELYTTYLATGKVQENHLIELTNLIEGKEVLIIAPGKSSYKERNTIKKFVKAHNVISISINFEYSEIETDYIFLSNLRRYRELDISKLKKCIITSNIPSVDAYLQTGYRNLLNDVSAVKDNSGMMLIKFLMDLNVKKIYIAGIDGYSIDPSENFANEKMNFYTKKATFEAMNDGLEQVLKKYKKVVNLEYITNEKYIKL